MSNPKEESQKKVLCNTVYLTSVVLMVDQLFRLRDLNEVVMTGLMGQVAPPLVERLTVM